jgi:steroid delta-isomerase
MPIRARHNTHTEHHTSAADSSTEPHFRVRDGDRNGQSVRVAVAHSQVRAWAENYLDVVNRRDPDLIAELFALNATVEDPVGPSFYKGRDAIRGMFERAATDLSLMEVRRVRPISVAESYAAFAVVATTEMGGARQKVDVVSVLNFGDDGLITSMRAFWNFEEVRSVVPND